jgi:hypothetical protein
MGSAPQVQSSPGTRTAGPDGNRSGGAHRLISGRISPADPGVAVNTCANNHAQLWLNQPVPVIAGGRLYSYTEFVNVHTRESLALNATTSGTAVLQQSSGDTLRTAP